MTADRLREEVNRTIDSETARAYLDRPWAPGEREQALALIRWFKRRYPTPAERLAYVRRAYARWSRTARPTRRD
jgi:hypothetical protein